MLAAQHSTKSEERAHDVDRKHDPLLRIVRRVNAPPDQVFDALVNPDTMSKWLFTEPETTFDIDLVTGGKWSITTRREGIDFTAAGTYVEVMLNAAAVTRASEGKPANVASPKH